jgi:DeoR/GlpR family transcriptional regulator of sugar metabolism
VQEDAAFCCFAENLDRLFWRCQAAFSGFSIGGWSLEVTDSEALESPLPSRRRAQLVRLVRSRGQVTVAELAALFDMSLDTIRRDLDLLAERGLLTRTHGGAVPLDALAMHDTPFAERLNAHKAAKTRIARAAALVGDDEALIVNGGSTTRAFAAELSGRRNLTIVTNNLSIPAVLSGDAVRDVYVLGGQYRPESQVTIGEVRFAPVSGISVDSAVIGVGGITALAGLSTTLLAEAVMIEAMIATASRTIVVADAGKFGHNAFAHIVPLSRIHVLVTDEEPPAELRAALVEAGVDVLVASP